MDLVSDMVVAWQARQVLWSKLNTGLIMTLPYTTISLPLPYKAYFIFMDLIVVNAGTLTAAVGSN